MRIVFGVLAALALATTALAQGKRDGDVEYTTQGLTDLLSGQVIELFDGSRAFYGADGAYEYVYEPGGPPFRRQFTTDGSTVCVKFENAFDRCDMFGDGGGRTVLIIDDGTRFPVRSITPWERGS